MGTIMKWLERAMPACGISVPEGMGLICQSACDSDAVCRQILLGHKDKDGRSTYKHVFGNIQTLLSNDAKKELAACQPQDDAPVEQKKECYSVMRDCLYEGGDECFDTSSATYCHACQKYCDCFDLDVSRPACDEIDLTSDTLPWAEAAESEFGQDETRTKVQGSASASVARAPVWTMIEGGSSCTAFANYGSRLMLADKTAEPFYVFTRFVRAKRPLLFFHEITSARTAELITGEIGDLYCIEQVEFDASLTGRPKKRPRRLTFGYRKDSVKYYGSAAEFLNLVSTRVMCEADVYFVCNDERRCEQIEQAKANGFHVGGGISGDSSFICPVEWLVGPRTFMNFQEHLTHPERLQALRLLTSSGCLRNRIAVFLTSRYN
jgi:hypothetical protein